MRHNLIKLIFLLLAVYVVTACSPAAIIQDEAQAPSTQALCSNYTEEQGYVYARGDGGSTSLALRNAKANLAQQLSSRVIVVNQTLSKEVNGAGSTNATSNYQSYSEVELRALETICTQNNVSHYVVIVRLDQRGLTQKTQHMFASQNLSFNSASLPIGMRNSEWAKAMAALNGKGLAATVFLDSTATALNLVIGNQRLVLSQSEALSLIDWNLESLEMEVFDVIGRKWESSKQNALKQGRLFRFTFPRIECVECDLALLAIYDNGTAQVLAFNSPVPASSVSFLPAEDSLQAYYDSGVELERYTVLAFERTPDWLQPYRSNASQVTASEQLFVKIVYELARRESLFATRVLRIKPY